MYVYLKQADILKYLFEEFHYSNILQIYSSNLQEILYNLKKYIDQFNLEQSSISSESSLLASSV